MICQIGDIWLFDNIECSIVAYKRDNRISLKQAAIMKSKSVWQYVIVNFIYGLCLINGYLLNVVHYAKNVIQVRLGC